MDMIFMMPFTWYISEPMSTESSITAPAPPLVLRPITVPLMLHFCFWKIQEQVSEKENHTNKIEHTRQAS